MALSIREIGDIIVMTVVVGYIFSRFFPIFRSNYKRIQFSIMITAPALIFHELAHKFVAIAYGLQATFHAAYFWLFLGIVLTLFKAPFVFFVPGYVSISCAQPPCIPLPITSAIIAFSGPALNLALFLASWILLRNGKFSRKTTIFLLVTKKINLLLFIFNMLPLPLFDGYKVYAGIIEWLAS